MKGFIVSASSKMIDNDAVVEFFGRLENGESFHTINKIKPYFFIRKEDKKDLSKLLSKFTVSETGLKNFEGEEVLKVTASTPVDLGKLYRVLHSRAPTYEADIKPMMRFIIDNDILASINIEGKDESSQRVNHTFKEPKINPSDFVPNLKVLSIDTESDHKTGALYCIGMCGEGYSKSIMITTKKISGVISCKTEEEALIKFREELLSYDPDIITGWNVIDFDLVYLRDRFKKHKIPFDLGRTESPVKIRIESDFFRASSADIPGRQVLDGMNMIRDPFIQEAPSIRFAEFGSYSLEDVAQAFLGTGKLIKGKDRHEEINNLYTKGTEQSLKELSDYNMTDCELVYNILKKAKMIELAIERSQLTGLPLDRLTASVAAFDSLYIREARKRGIVSPTTQYIQKEARIKGGYVYSMKPGIYHNVLIFDFKSLYPSIMRTFNIDPASYTVVKEKGVIEAPNGAFFRNHDGILPQLLQKLYEARTKSKKEKRELSSYAIKVIMNSMFGVLANPNCRYFNMKIANSITHFGQMIIQLTAKEIEKKGYTTIYADTDSVFIETQLNKDKANKLAREIESYITEFYKKYVKEKYNRESFLDLEFEKQYISLMIPKVRGKDEETAAKKRYAGLVEIDGKEEIEITGLEAIRGDWTDAAREFQRELLRKAFKEEPIETFIHDYIKKIKEGKLDSKLVYRKSIRKGLDEYTKTTPPHVKAARKLPHLDSNLIQYYITTDGPEPIQNKTHSIDYDHYIEKQIKPIANQILSLLNKTFEDTVEKSKQSKLF